jgi:hypothetical protein
VAHETLERLAGLQGWTEALTHSTQEEIRTLYTTLVARIAVDADAGTLTVEYMPALAGWYGRSSDTIPLPSQKRRGTKRGAEPDTCVAV